MDSQLEAYLREAIPRVAATTIRIAKAQAGATTSREDIEQDMWLTALEHEALLAGHLESGNEHNINTVLMTGAQRTIRNEQREQRTQKAVAEGYEAHDEVFYSTALLRKLLPAYLDQGVTETPPRGREQPGKVSSGGGAYGEWAVTIIDIDRAFRSLSAERQKILSRYFSYPQGSGGFTHLEIAGRMGMPPRELSSRIHYALKALEKILGGQDPWKGR